MQNRNLFAAAALLLSLSTAACGADASSDGTDGAQGSGSAGEGTLASAPVTAGEDGAHATAPLTTPAADDGTDGKGAGGTGAPADPNAGAGAKPASACSVSKDGSGFFVRNTSKSSYVAYVPASYDGTTPMRLIVGLHGCGDNAHNFATWAVNPYDTRSTQTHIGISIGGKDGTCWNGSDDDKILAAVDDISSCFWVHQKKVVIAGYSSGGEIGYRVGLKNASRFAGIIIEDSGLSAAGDVTTLLAGASWKLNVAHLTHTSDSVFPLAGVRADWSRMSAAGFPLQTRETAGDHNGTSSDWVEWLIPKSATFVAP